MRMEAEHALLRLMKRGGKRAANAALKAARPGGTALTRLQNVGDTATWRATYGPRGETMLQAWFVAGRDMQATSVTYVRVVVPKVPPAQRALHALQQAFYERYLEVGQRWYQGIGPRRLPRVDNVILLIGELEADVNNGGFSQYLDNKGRRRARAALAALRTVGARKTAEMLEAAMSPGVTEKRLEALDRKFYRGPEDLAGCTMEWVRAD